MRLLKQVNERLDAQIGEAETRLGQLRKEIAEIQSRRASDLQKALIDYLVTTELPALPGIGQNLASAIRSQLYRGNLENLLGASRVAGIGTKKEATINKWVYEQKRLLPNRLTGDFPGKADIITRTNQQIESRQASTPALEQTIAMCRQLNEPVERELAWLSKVSVSDFRKALKGSDSQTDRLNRYNLGVFAPWEPPPDWFVAANSENPVDQYLMQQTS